MTPKFDTYQEVTDAIVAALEAGTKPWRKGWVGGSIGSPRRATGEYYRGINVLLLWASAERSNFASDRWLTFKQAIDLGAAVRKGEKGTRIVFFKSLELEGENAAGEAETRRIPLLRTYTVFNADQVDGLPARFHPAPIAIVAGKQRDEAAEAALRSCGAEIREDRDGRAYYAPGDDFVHMPAFELFDTAGTYLATMSHELCHWSGHKTRLDRQQLNRFGSKDYAFEELVAEIGAAFVGARLGIVGEHIDNHAAYLASWLKALRDDKRAIFKAASLAQAAADLVLANAAGAEDQDDTREAPIAVPAQQLRQVGQLALL
jgi:antirestriction protein ArdC